jgi:hypothetical protein
MNSLTLRFATPTVVTLAIVCVIGTAVIASAQLLSELGSDICRAPASEVAAEASFLANCPCGKPGPHLGRPPSHRRSGPGLVSRAPSEI